MLAPALTAATAPMVPTWPSFRWLDLGLVGVGAALLFHGFGVVLFQIAFVLVLVAALRLPFREFAMRALAMGLVSTAALVKAVALGEMVATELWEVPGFGIALSLAFVYSAEQDRRGRAVDKARNHLIATVTHDLRNPLTAAMGMAEILNQSTGALDSDDVASFSTTIVHAVEEALHLVEDLTTSSRIEAGALKVEVHPADIVEVATTLVGHHHVVGQEIGLHVSSVPPPCITDEMRLRQVVRNLVTNAQRYGGPSITISVGERGGFGWIAVVDDGDGVDAADADAIFEPYVQSGSGAKPPESTGLGLANARRIARMMGGDLTYRREGDDTVFEVTVPALAPSTTPLIG